MKIVQINTVFGTGSTGRIVSNLHNAILKSGNESLVAYGRSTGTNNSDKNIYNFGNKTDFYNHVLLNFVTGKNAFGSVGNTRKLISWLDHQNPDVIHLHNLHGFYLNIELLFSYLKKRTIPIVWTLHDCWPFTGQCAYFDYIECSKWVSGCHDCPIYRTNYPYSLFRDNSKWNYAKKKELFTGLDSLTIVSPSEWLKTLVDRSFLNEYQTVVINNGIDTDIFKPMVEFDMFKRDHLKIILGVANIWSETKGLNHLLSLSNLLKEHPEYKIVIIGVSKKQKADINRHYPNIIPLQKTNSIDELVKWYNQAYVFVNPTLEDNFPTVNLEALACGTPVITFNTGGSPESLTTDCGIIVPKCDDMALKNAIMDMSISNSKACRLQGLKYQIQNSNMEYLKLYESLL